MHTYNAIYVPCRINALFLFSLWMPAYNKTYSKGELHYNFLCALCPIMPDKM